MRVDVERQIEDESDWRVDQRLVLEANRHRRLDLLAMLIMGRSDVRGNVVRETGQLLDGEGPAVAEERSQQPVGHVDLDAEARVCLVPPFAYVGDAGEDQREP